MKRKEIKPQYDSKYRREYNTRAGMFSFNPIVAVSAAFLRDIADGYAGGGDRKDHQHDDHSNVTSMTGVRRLAVRISGGSLGGNLGRYFSGYLSGFLGRFLRGRRIRAADHLAVIRLAVIVIIIANEKT